MSGNGLDDQQTQDDLETNKGLSNLKMSQASGSNVSVSAQMKPNAETDTTGNGRSGVSENKEHVRKDGQNVNASFGTSSQTSRTASGHIQSQTKNLPVDKHYSEKYSMMPQQVLPASEKYALQSSESGSPGNERAAVHSVTYSTSDAGQLKTHSSGDKVLEAMETSMSGSIRDVDDKWHGPPTDMNDVEMKEIDRNEPGTKTIASTPYLLGNDSTSKNMATTHGVRPKTSSAGREDFLSLWPSTVKFKIVVKTPNGELTEKPSLKQINIAAFQFLVLESSTLKEKMKKAVHKSFKIEFDPNEVKVKFGLEANSRDEGTTMITAIEGELTKLMEHLNVKELPLDQNAFSASLNALKEAKFDFLQRDVHVYCLDSEKLVIVGPEKMVEDFFTKLVGFVSSKTQASVSGHQTERTEYVPIGLDNCTLFRSLRGKEEFIEKFPQIKMEILSDNVKICGPMDQVSQCVEEVKKWPLSIKSAEEHANKHFIQLLEMPEVREYVTKYIHGKGIICVYATWAEKEIVKIYALSDQVVKLGFTFLHDCAFENQFGSSYNFVFADQAYGNFYEKYSGKKMIHIEGKELTILVATKDVMLEFHEISKMATEKEVNALKQNAKLQKENRKTAQGSLNEEIRITLNPFQVTVLNDQYFRARFQQEFPKVEIHVKNENTILVLNGSEKQIEETKNAFGAFFENIGHYEKSIEKETYCLINEKPEVQNYLTKILQTNEIHCNWCLCNRNGEYQIFGTAKDNETAKRGIDVILQSVQISSLLIVSPITKDIIQKIQDIAESNQFSTKAMVFGNKMGEEDIVTVATSDIFTEFEKRIHSLIYIAPKIEFLNIRVEKLYFLKRYCLKHIEEVEKIFHVTVRLDNPPYICISANYEHSNNIQLCIDEIRKLSMQKIDVDCIRVQDLEMVRRITDKTAKDFVLSVEEKHKCYVSQSESKAEQICTYSILDKDFHVVVIHGRTCDLDVDAVVVPANECLFPIGYGDDFLKGDEDLRTPIKKNFSMKNPKKYTIGEIEQISAKSNFLFHTVLLTVTTTQNQNVKKGDINLAMQKVILHCEKEGIQSLAIPVQITEDKKASFQGSEIIEALNSQLITKNVSSIQEVYLCIFDEHEVNEVVEMINATSLSSFDCFDWRPLLSKPMQIENCPMKVHVTIGSLVDQHVDMLVNTVGIDLNLKNGIVSNLILERAGEKIQEECSANRPEGIKHGSVIVTTAGYMKNCKSICHGALTEWHHRSGLSLQVLRVIMWQCLTVADSRQYKSVAFPAFGTGKLHYPSRQVAETMIDIINKFGVKNPETSLRDIQIVLHSKDTCNIKVFQAAYKNWQERKQLATDYGRQQLDILECRVPAEYGNVCVQVWPITESLDGDLICYFDQSFYSEPKLKMKEDGSLTITMSPSPYFESGLKQILIWVEKYRITELSLVFEKKQTESLESILKTVKECVFCDTSDRGYLEVVKIYVKDSQLNSLTAKLPKGEEKGGLIEYIKKKTGIKRHRGSTAWMKTIPDSQRANYMVTIAGYQDKVHAAKKEIMNYLEKKNPVVPLKHKLSQLSQDWAYKKVENTGMIYVSLPQEVCNSIAFAALKGETVIEFPHEEGGIWIYDTAKGVCYDKVNKTSFELVNMDVKSNNQTLIEGSSVDPVMIPQAKIIKKDEPFTTLKAEIRYGTANLKTHRAIEDLLTRSNIKFSKLSTGKFDVECSSFDELKNLNSILSEKFGTEEKPVLSYTQKTTTENKNENQFQKTQTKATPMSNKSNVITFELEDREYAMLKHFCSNSKILNGRCEYKDGSLKRTLGASEKEADLKSDFTTQKTFIASLSSSDIFYENGISDEKLHEIQRNVADSGDIFCYLSSNRKMIALYGSNYEKLGEGRHKAEICLGLKQQSKGRRNRVFMTDTDLSTTKREQKPASSAEQTVKRPTDFSRSVSASSGPRTEMIFKTSEGIIVKVYNGNILSLDVDCIVNAANENLNHGGGVAYVIAAAAGYDFEKESDDYILRNGPIKEGSCCSTSAGKLRYKSVIHTVGPKWHSYNDKKECCRILRKSVECCFFEAKVNGMSSVAIPSISAGIFGVPKDVCCKEYGKAVEDFSRTNGNTTCLKEIHFIDKDAGMIGMIQKEFSQKFNITSSSTGSSNSGGFTAGGERRITRSLSSPDDSEVSKEKTQIRQDNFAGSMSKFLKQFMAATDLKVIVVQDDIIKRKVSTIVCPQDERVSNKGGIARAIEEVSDDSYRQSVKTIHWISKCDIRKVKASPSSLPFQYVLHTVPPRYDKIAEDFKSSFNNDLEVTIRNILRHCSDKGDVTSVAMPVLGIGKDGLETPVSTFAKIFLLVLLREIKSTRKFDVKEIHIVTNDLSAAVIVADELEKEKSFTKVTSFSRTRNKGDKGNMKQNMTQDTKMAMAGKTFKGELKDGDENCVICMEPNTKPRELTCGHVFCENCVQECFKVKPVCPTCGSIQGVIKGDQPPGRMIRREMGYSLPTFKCNTIELEYEIYAGTQGEEHPNPGKPFKGIRRTAYFPNTKKGKLIADLLKIAFDRRLVFTIGHSRTTGQEGVVTWNDIHHKTSSSYGHQFGYPDEGYFDRVLDELKIKGVTEKDL